MKIVHVYHHYYPVIGGLERAVQSLTEELAGLGHEVHVITSRYGTEGRPKEEIINNVFIHRVKALRAGFPDLTYPFEYPVRIFKNADIVHGHSQNSLFVVKMIEKAKEIGVKSVMYFMAVDALHDHPNLLVRTLGPLYSRWTLKKAIQLSDVKLVRSLRDHELLERKYGIRAIYIPDGVPRWFISCRYNGHVFRERYNLDGDYILYIGRMHPLKGIDVLIRAMPYVRKHVDLKLVVIGPGDQRPYRGLAEKLGVEDHIVFLGYVDEETKIGAIDGSLGVVIPSVSSYVEVYPMAISEAWARGKPVIATSVGGIPYRVRHLVNGLLVPPRDPKSLAETVVTLASDKTLSTRLGNIGRSSIMTWDEIAKKITEIYERVAED
ncbi:MAG: glycosyltransferase family 4 protein [Acidilobaceae archaeon]|jgi:glycosyltransferase involved in cell wall biosynthesis